MEGQARRLRERYGARVALVRLPRVMEISSTQVRELLVRNRVEAQGASVVPGLRLYPAGGALWRERRFEAPL